MVRLAALLLFVSALVVAPARAAAPVAEIPYRLDYDGLYVVAGLINGKGPFSFVVDTGATRTIVFARAAAAVGGLRPAQKEPTSVLGLSSKGKFATYLLDEIRFGGERLGDLETVILDDWDAGGRSPDAVLGLDFLARYHAEFDADRRVLKLYRPDAPFAPPSRGWKSATISKDVIRLPDGVLFTTTARLNGRSIPFMIDTGATGTIVNAAAADRANGAPVELDSLRLPPRMTDALSEQTKVKLAIFDRMNIGEARWGRVVFVVYDAPIFDDLGVAGKPFGLLGINIFEGRSFAFDFRAGKLFIGPAAPKPR